MPRKVLSNISTLIQNLSQPTIDAISSLENSLSGNLELMDYQINLKSNKYINIQNAVRILESFSNWNGYLKLYTEVESNFKVGDTVYITYTPGNNLHEDRFFDTNSYIYRILPPGGFYAISMGLDSWVAVWPGGITFYEEVSSPRLPVPDGVTQFDPIYSITDDPILVNNVFNLENPAVAFEDYYLGYKVLNVNVHKNEIVIDRDYNDILSGKTLKNQFLSKASCRGGLFRNGIIDGVVLYDCDIYSGMTFSQGVMEWCLVTGLTFDDKYKDIKTRNTSDNYNSKFYDPNSIKISNTSTKLILDNSYYNIVENTDIYNSDVLNGKFYKCNFIGNGYQYLNIPIGSYSGTSTPLISGVTYNILSGSLSIYHNNGVLFTVWDSGYTFTFTSVPVGYYVYSNSALLVHFNHETSNIITNGNFSACTFEGYTINGGKFYDSVVSVFNCWNNGYWDNSKGTGEFFTQWHNGIWNRGIFSSQYDWINGIFNNGTFMSPSKWLNGVANGGSFNNITWNHGLVRNAKFLNSTIENCVFNNGSVSGCTWNGGTFNNGQITDTKINGGTFYNGTVVRGSINVTVSYERPRIEGGSFSNVVMNDGDIISMTASNLTMNGGKIYGGVFTNGLFYVGDIYNGGFYTISGLTSGLTIHNGIFTKSSFSSSRVHNGNFTNCIAKGVNWEYGIFTDGTMNNSIWLDGYVNDSMFSGNTWSNGHFYGKEFWSGVPYPGTTFNAGYFHYGKLDGIYYNET